MKPLLSAVPLLVAATWLCPPAIEAASAQGFYAGKTLTIIVGFSPGGVYDATARVLAKHIGDHIPGKPAAIVQTMLGAGGTTAVIHLYNNAVRDGTVIGMPPRNYPIAPYSNVELHYDAKRFIALGSTTSEVLVGAVWYKTPIKSFNDLMTHEITAGATSFYDDIGSLSLVTKRITGAKLNIVTGYPGGNDISAAMEKGEVDAEFGWSWGSIKSRARPWLDDKKINIVFQLGMEKAPDLPDVPFVMDYAKSERDKRALELLMAPEAFAWPFVAPPDVPADRVALLRAAFDATMTDPEFVADAKRVNLEINPMSGVAMQALIDRVLSFDESVVARVKELVTPPN